MSVVGVSWGSNDIVALVSTMTAVHRGAGSLALRRSGPKVGSGVFGSRAGSTVGSLVVVSSSMACPACWICYPTVYGTFELTTVSVLLLSAECRMVWCLLGYWV